MKPKEKPTCGICGGTDIFTEIDAGWDCDESGEEAQHIDHCKTCGAWRFNTDRSEFGKGVKKEYGNWIKKGEYV